jgi:hypothetical protein
MIGKIRGREAGMSFWPFVIALVLVLVAVVFWYDGTKDTERIKKERDDARAEAASWKDRFDKANGKLIDLVPATGFPDAENHPDRAKIADSLTAFLDKWREKLTLEFDTDRYAPTGSGGQVEKLGGTRVRVVYLPTKAELTGLSVESTLPMLEAAAARMQVDIKRAFEAAATANGEVANLRTQQTTALSAKDAAAAEIRNQMAAQQQAASERERELREQLAAKDAAVAQAQAELESVRTKAAATEAQLARDLSQKSAEVQTLARRDAPMASEGPDGEVLSAGAGIAVLNRGKKDMLMPGTSFVVLGRRKGGSLYEKGSVHVTVVDAEVATARVVSESSDDPVGRGDLIQSAIYSPNRQLRFTLVGDFRKMGRSQAEARLKQLGAAVDAQVSTLTHYLVMGTGDNLEESDSYRRAKEYGITILTEDALSTFTMY